MYGARTSLTRLSIVCGKESISVEESFFKSQIYTLFCLFCTHEKCVSCYDESKLKIPILHHRKPVLSTTPTKTEELQEFPEMPFLSWPHLEGPFLRH